MAIKTWALTSDLTEQVARLASGLSEFVSERQDTFNERSDAWRDSDKGCAVDTWLEELGNLVDVLEALETVAGGPER